MGEGEKRERSGKDGWWVRMVEEIGGKESDCEW